MPKVWWFNEQVALMSSRSACFRRARAGILWSAAALTIAAAAMAATASDAVVPPALSADQIAQRNLDARGGGDAWHRVNALGLRGTMEIPPPPLGPRQVIVEQAQAADGRRHQTLAPPKALHVPFLMALRRPHQMRLEIQFRNQVAAQVFDGKQGWLVSGAPGQWTAQPLAPDQANAAAEQEDLDGPLIDYAAKGTRIELEAVEPIDGRSAFRLKLQTASGIERHLWIDCQSFLDVKIDGLLQINGKVRLVSIYFRDYQPADGLMIARTIETRPDGLDESQITHIDTVAVNPAVDEATFRRPR